MSIKPQNPNPTRLIQWVTAAGGVVAGQLVKSSTGAAPVAAAHTGATLLGVAIEDSDADAAATIFPLRGTILEIDYDSTATKVTCTAADLGTLFDIVVDGTTGEMVVDLDDTTGGFLFLVGYDNDAMKAYCVVDDADVLLSI